MPRQKIAEFTRSISPDLEYNSELVQKFIGVIMRRGKRTVAERIVYEALDELTKRSQGKKDKGLQLFEKAFENVTPMVEVRPRRVGGSVYQIPTQVRPERARALALRWIIQAAAERSDKVMGKRLAHELLDAVDGKGGAIKKKNDAHKMAESNRAFSHYAW